MIRPAIVSAPVILLTGLSGSGKSTICNGASTILKSEGIRVHTLDGDVIRSGLCSDLGFSPEDRFENLRRVAHVAKILSEQDVTVFIAVIAPMERMRDLIRRIVPQLQEVLVSAPLEVCEKRDPKGLYAKARAGLLQQFTGVATPFEEPTHPVLTCYTAQESEEDSIEKLVSFVHSFKKPVD